VGILCYYSGKIINSNNGIIYHEGSVELCSLRLDNSFDKFTNLVCREIGWNLAESNVDITWKMLSGDHLNHYICVPIISDMSFNEMVRLITDNRFQILQLYLSRKLKVGNFLS